MLVITSILVLNIFASLFQSELLLRLIKPLFIPFTILYFYFTKANISKPILLFFIFSFIGDFLSTIPQYSFVKIASVFYIFSYLSLVGLVWDKLKVIKFNALVYTYFGVVFSICVYFTYQFYMLANGNFLDQWNVYFFVCKSLVLLVLGFLAFAVYLDTDSKSSILFLAMVFCFGFSDVLYYISQNYIYTWSFVVSEVVLHVCGLVLICNYIVNVNEGLNSIEVLVSRNFNPQLN